MIRKVFAKLLVLAPLVLVVACGGDSGGDASAQAEVRTTTLPGFPHAVDFLSAPAATRAVVFLHGGAGRNFKLAYDLGLNSVNAPPTPATVNADWLARHQVLAVFPQGQADSGLAYTWNNHAMDSGQDDVAFLRALAAHIRSTYGITDIYLAGHSNGGMMVNRMWCESPETFKAYISLAGPASAYYLNVTPCMPAQTQPYFGIVGERDDVLQVEGNWEAQTWQINPLLDDDFVNPTLIGEWVQHQARADLMCAQAPSLGDSAISGGTETWSNCGGRIRLQRLLLAGHMIDSLDEQTVGTLIDAVVGFIDDIETP